MTPIRIGPLSALLPRKPAPRRGRPPRDPIESLRARIWYWHVKFAANLSDYGLNQHFRKDSTEDASSAPAAKVFERIRRIGVVPIDDFSSGLVGRVDRDVLCRDTASVFRSLFWRLLAHPEMDVPTLKTLIEVQSWRLNRFRPTHEEVWGMHQRKKLAFVAGDMESYAESIVMLSNIGTLDSAALLGLLYKEAFIFGEPERAVLLKDAFIATIQCNTDRMAAFECNPQMSHLKGHLRRDITELQERSVNRVIYTAHENAQPGDHAETHYPWV